MKIDTEKMTLQYVLQNKAAILRGKKQTPIFSECLIHRAAIPEISKTATKDATKSPDNPNRLKVTLVGNTALYCDSHMDVLAIGSYTKTVQEQGANIPHLRDHIHTLEGKIGKTLKVYTEMIDVKDLGVENSDVEQTEVLLMDSELVKEWNPKIFQLYKDEEVKQHSIGLQYTRLVLCVNDPDEKEEFENWQKYYGQVINKEKVDARGFFFIGKYIRVIKSLKVINRN